MPPAAARVETPVPAAGPVLAGERVVWATARADGGVDVRSATGSADARVVQEVRPADAGEPPASRLRPQLAASPARIALVANPATDSRSWDARVIFTGPPVGPFGRVGGRCGLPGNYPDYPRPVDVDGDAIVYPACDEAGGLEVREFSPAPMTQRILAKGATGARLAGRWVAWLEGGTVWDLDVFAGDLVVYDRLTMREAYRIPRAELGRGVHSLDLQDDGKVAFSFGVGRGHAVGWASPEAPSVHRIPLSERNVYEVRIGAGRIAFLGGRGVNLDVPLAEVGVSDLGGSVRVLASGAQDLIGPESFDFDGTRVAWYTLGCTDATIETRGVDDAQLPYRARSGCALRLNPKPSRRPVLLSGRYVRLYVDCAGFADRTCRARDLILTSGGRVLARSDRAERIDLTAAGRRAFRGRSKLHVRGTALLTDAAGRRERRTATFTVRRAS